MAQVVRIVTVTHEGAFGILPHRLDCVASLIAGILIVELKGEDEIYIAIDEGVLVKTGLDVVISVRNAIGSMALPQLRKAVDEDFNRLDEQEQQLHFVLVKMETGFIRSLAAVQKDSTL